MIVNYHYNFIFIHIPKTAGTSIREALNSIDRNLFLKGRNAKIFVKPLSVKSVSNKTKHETYIEFLQKFERRTGKPIEKALALKPIAFCRNPYARFISLHRYLLETHRDKYPNVPLDVNDFAAIFAKNDEPWLSQIRSLKTQYSFISKTPKTTFIGYFENLNEDFSTIISLLGLKLNPNPNHKNKTSTASKTPKAHHELNENAKKVIRHKYAIDFKFFKYAT